MRKWRKFPLNYYQTLGFEIVHIYSFGVKLVHKAGLARVRVERLNPGWRVVAVTFKQKGRLNADFA
jgi:hypothetical protein